MKIKQAKICTKCGEEKLISEFYSHKHYTMKRGVIKKIRSQCKKCNKKWQKKYRETHREQISQRLSDWRKKQEEIKEDDVSSARHIYTKKERKYNNKKARESMQRARKYLRDNYIKHLFCQTTVLTTKDIPIELVELKREHIKLRRLMKGIENENDEGSKRKTG